MLKDQNLDDVTPIPFKGTLLIPIAAKVVNLFGNKEIKFQIKVKDNKIIIESSEILADPNFQDNIPESEAINVKY